MSTTIVAHSAAPVASGNRRINSRHQVDLDTSAAAVAGTPVAWANGE